MKKPMKFKRYEGGGEISGTVDPKEAADKEAGLKASKGDDIGFLQRLRMGNIDDPSSEAYKRFGAGRGRSERNPVNESVSVNEPRPQFTRREPVILPYKPSEETMKRNTSGMDVQDESGMVNKRLKRNPETGELYDTEVTASSVKPTAPKPMGKREVGESVSVNQPLSKREVGESVSVNQPKTTKKSAISPEEMMEADNPRSVRAEKAPAAPPPSAPKASSSRVPTPEQASANRAAAAEKVKGAGSSVADYFSNLETPSKRKLREQKEKAAKGSYASGGSVSSASRRADGIATKGKTRGRMC
jgi:hypothetical protein